MNRLGRTLFDLIMYEEDGALGGGNPPPPAAPQAANPPIDNPPANDPPAYEPHPYQAQARGDYKTDEFFKDYGDITSVMESLKESKGKVAELTKKAEEAAANAPKVPESYKLLDNLGVDGISLEKEEVEQLQESALAISATQEQFEAMAKAAASQKAAQQKFILERRDASVKVLQEMWPGEKEYTDGWSRYNTAITGLEGMGITGIKEMMNNPAYGDNAVLIRIISEFGRFFGDDTLLDGNGGALPDKVSGQLSYPSMK